MKLWLSWIVVGGSIVMGFQLVLNEIKIPVLTCIVISDVSLWIV